MQLCIYRKQLLVFIRITRSLVITISQIDVYDMITTRIGYLSDTKTIHSDGTEQIINNKLKPNSVLIDEVTVKAKDKNRIKTKKI